MQEVETDSLAEDEIEDGSDDEEEEEISPQPPLPGPCRGGDCILNGRRLTEHYLICEICYEYSCKLLKVRTPILPQWTFRCPYQECTLYKRRSGFQCYSICDNCFCLIVTLHDKADVFPRM